MQRFLVRRLLITIVTLFAVSVIIFVMARISGDPRTMMLGDFFTQEQYDLVGVKLGLDKSYFEQYWVFIKDLVRGDFGQSIKEGRPARDVIGQRFLATLELGGAAFIFSIIVGVPLGILSSVRRGGVMDTVGKMVALIGQSAPGFWLGIMLIFLFAVRLDMVPPSGRQEWNSIFLPAITLGWFFVAANMRLVRSAMLDVLDSEYIKLARGQGSIHNQSHLEACVAQRHDPAPDLRRSDPGQPGGRFHHHRAGIRLARVGTAGNPVHSRVRLPGFAGSGHHVHPAVRGGRLLGGYHVRLHRPQNSIRIEALV